MATLLAPAAARTAAKQRGLSVPAEPEPVPAANDVAPRSKQTRTAERREQQQRARERLWPLLHDVFPEAFRVPAVPLAIGIHRQILDVVGEDIDPDELSAFLKYWVRRWSYLHAVWRGEARRNLDGSLAGVPTIEQLNGAAKMLWGERARPIGEHIIAEPSAPGHA